MKHDVYCDVVISRDTLPDTLVITRVSTYHNLTIYNILLYINVDDSTIMEQYDFKGYYMQS